MTRGETSEGVDFEALRLGIEGNDPELVLGFYADDAELSIVNAEAPGSSPFELRGKAEIAKHLRVAFGQGTSHRVEREVVGANRMTFWEACQYPNGGRVWVETILEVREGKIVHQVDMVARDRPADRAGATYQEPPNRQAARWADAAQPGSLLRSEQPTGEEDQ